MKDLSQAAIEKILSVEEFGVLALTDGRKPYCIPLAFVYSRDSHAIYFGFPEEGRKMKYIQTNAHACFCVVHGMASVVAEGQLLPASNPKEIRSMLEASVKKHGGNPELVRERIENKLQARIKAEADPSAIKTYKLEIREMGGKGWKTV